MDAFAKAIHVQYFALVFLFQVMTKMLIRFFESFVRQSRKPLHAKTIDSYRELGYIFVQIWVD
jgi:hypothetical protein